MLLLLAALLLSRHIDPEKQRYQQHLSYNTQVEDTSLSIDEDTFSSHLPVVSIETGGGDCLKTRIVERSAAIRLPHPQWGV